jgi:hypothetical protein
MGKGLACHPMVAPTLPSVSATLKKPGQGRVRTREQKCCAFCRSAPMYRGANHVTKLLFQSAHKSNHGVNGLWGETMSEPGFIDFDGSHRAAALGDDLFQLHIRLALHLS